MHFQDVMKRAQEEAKQGRIEIALYLDPIAEYEEDQLGYCPMMALDLFPHCIIVGTVSQTGEVTLRR